MIFRVFVFILLTAAITGFHQRQAVAADEMVSVSTEQIVSEKSESSVKPVTSETSVVSGKSGASEKNIAAENPVISEKTGISEKSVLHDRQDLSENKIEPPFYLKAYVQLWYVFENIENSKKQEVTSDRAADVSSGFSINRARLEYEKRFINFGGRFTIRFDGGTPGLLDAYGYYRLPFFNITLSAGQMKIPSTYEAGMSDTELDFATRSTFSNETVNWSLSKSPSSVSAFTSVQTQGRDTGIGITAEYRGLKLYTYAGNGLGANMFVGAEEKKQTVYSNSPEDMFYGARCDADIFNFLSIHNNTVSSFIMGGHISRNKHDNFLYNDTRTVLDMDRFSWSADIRLSLYKRIYFTAMTGGGSINDNLDDSVTSPGVVYNGCEFKLTGDVIPGLMKLGYRYDGYVYKNKIFGGSDTLYTHTAGISIRPVQEIKITADYKWKTTGGNLNPDLDDNIFILQTQFVL